MTDYRIGLKNMISTNYSKRDWSILAQRIFVGQFPLFIFAILSISMIDFAYDGITLMEYFIANGLDVENFNTYLRDMNIEVKTDLPFGILFVIIFMGGTMLPVLLAIPVMGLYPSRWMLKKAELDSYMKLVIFWKGKVIYRE